MIPQSSTNLKNRVNKLYLPKTKPLLPLFEVISNSIHAIQEKKLNTEKTFKGKISIKAIRNGDEETLKKIGDKIENFPINSFSIVDNGIGLNDDNFKSFAEFDSEKKADIGGKGIGRLVCLKAFRLLTIESVYHDGNEYLIRKFNYKKSKDGFDNYVDSLKTGKKSTGATVILSAYEDSYQKHVPTGLMEIARQIITHFQLYYIQKIEPEILIMNQDNVEINLTNLFNAEFEKEILDKEFELSDSKFTVFISKSFKAKSHKVHYCAHERTVKDEGLAKCLEDFRYVIKEDEKEGYYFQVFVVSDFLDKNVNEERTSFNFSVDEDEDETEQKEITLSKIRNSTIQCIEELLSEFLKKVRKEKLDAYLPIIERDYPNYHSVINYNKEEVERLPVGLTKEELDVKLYQIESKWRVKVKAEGIELLEKKKDITTLDEYKELYSKYLTKFNDIGQSDLARYIVHRRAVIYLLDKLIELSQDEKFADEDIVHSLFFPIRETGNTVMSDKQNLWLLDERLTFNSLLASDKLFKQVSTLNSSSDKRMDLIVKQEEVYENATLFAEEKIPFESFTIVEFKKPERNDYKHGDIKKDPIKQVRIYIEEIINGTSKIKGKSAGATNNTPFYCYIVADITNTLKDILDYENFDPTPDGLGYFKFYYTKTSKAYIEVLPFKKVIKDAKQRNKILFDNLKLC